MSKSKHAPALFEVIGKDSRYQTGEGKLRIQSGSGASPVSRAARVRSIRRQTSGSGRSVEVKRRPATEPARTTQAIQGATSATLRTARDIRHRFLRMAEGRVSLSLNAANGMIAAGCLFLVCFGLFVVGYRSGTGEKTPVVGAGSAGEPDGAAQVRNGSPKPSVIQLGMAKPAGRSSEGADDRERTGREAGPPLKLVRRGAETADPGPAPAQPADGEMPVIEAKGPADPRVSGLTYIVIEYFPKSQNHDALAECRHVAGFLKSEGIESFVVAGQEGYQLLTGKGFKYKTEKQACLDYKAKIRRLAKEYKPLDRPYMFTSYEATYYPRR